MAAFRPTNQKMQAERAVRRLTGVAGVVNQIALRKQVSATDVRDTIVKAFHRAADLAAGVARQPDRANRAAPVAGPVRGLDGR
jgi:hypothetical protein